jgi:hypothetical protein
LLRLPAFLLLSTGCFSKPAPPAGLIDGDASITDDARITGDGMQADAPRPLCTIDDNFATAGPACGSWGTQSGSMMRVAERLQATPPAGGASTCTTQPLEPSGAITIDLFQLGNMADQNYALFDLTTQSGAATLNIYREAGIDKVNVACGVAQPGVVYSATTHRHLRYTLVPNGNDLTVQLLASSDGTTFSTVLASCTFLAGALGPVALTFGSAIDGSASLAPISYWDNLRYDCL